MDNSNSVSGSYNNSILGNTVPSASASAPASESGSGFFGWLKSINFTTWLIIILIFAFLGFNIFVYLAKGTQDIANFFGPFFEKIFGVTLLATGKAIDVTAEGAKAVVNTTANVLDTGLTDIQNITPTGNGKTSIPANTTSTSIPSQSVQNTMAQPDIMANNSLNKVLNTHQSQESNQDYEANEASSSVHSSGGWCYIGEDRGFRSCAEVSASDQCMSGEIFPSKDLCVHPNLRA